MATPVLASAAGLCRPSRERRPSALIGEGGSRVSSSRAPPFRRQTAEGSAPRNGFLGTSAKRHALRALPENDGSAEEETQVPSALIEAIPTKLNRVPHPRELRQHFYRMAKSATMGALDAGETRIQICMVIPELNTEMDVYRIGTMLEMVREVAMAIAVDGKRVKVCVQQALGQGIFTGLPLALSGVRRILEMMDWGEAAPFVALGQVGADQVDDETDVFVLIAPQNVVNGTVIYELQDMVNAAEEKGKPVVLVNPKLQDVPSSGGMMGVRGRAERLDFAKSFVYAGHFRLLYKAGTFYPIVGALRYIYGGPWQVYKRVDVSRREEEYKVIGEFASEPGPSEITKAFEVHRRQQAKRG